MKFDVEKATLAIVEWIKVWFEKNGKGCNAIVGISGGKDSSVVAALCKKALGADRVIGILMPNGIQTDIDASYKLVEHLNIKWYEINIHDAYLGVITQMNNCLFGRGAKQLSNSEAVMVSKQTRENLPPRLRMSVLYAMSQSMNGRVANTCNMSEDWVGYATRYGDGAGDFSPLANYTVQEVKAIGKYLGLPAELIEKVPSDGLCGKTDEDNLGFTYAVLDDYIRNGILPPPEIKEKIDAKHIKNLFKLQPMPTCPQFGYETSISIEDWKKFEN